MFLLILVMTLICGLGEATLFKTHPVNTLALPGGSISFSCTPVRAFCGGHQTLYWQRGPYMTPTLDTNIFKNTVTARSFNGMERYTVSFSDCVWTLRIWNIQPIDERYYSCYINYGFSKVARLTIIVDQIDTVFPSQIERFAGENAYFSCHTQPLLGHDLEYSWYVKTPGSYEWKELLENNSMIEFHNNKNIMTMLRLGIELNGSMVQCSAHNGSLSWPGTRHNGWLFVHPAEEVMKTTSEMVILDPQSTPSAQTSSLLPTKKQDPNHDSNNSSSGCTDSTVILVGWSLAAVFICLSISLLLYIVIIKRRSKANPNSTRVVQTTQDEDAEAYEEMEMETQLHGQAASTGRKETAPSSYQELIFK